ncbi:MAG: response regulator [Hyphomonadaceae bacterium]|nr:response regulator [Hyphomonadaceae bacterium]
MTQTSAKLRILIVEDEALVAMLIEDIILDLGHEVAAVAGRLEDGVAKAAALDIDCAVLDLNLNGQRTYPIAETLRQRGAPFLFVTGYGAAGLEPGWEDEIVVQKPFQQHELELGIARALAKRR